MSDYIKITGAREHNLKNINLTFPKNKLVVFTGLSGSGKTSLAFDTLYAEGQRRYVESLSSYARQFLGIMKKPDVDHIEGLSPAISIDQKTTSHNPRSTVGTITEIYDYLRLLYARIGHPHCPECGSEIATQSVDQIVNHVISELKSKISAKPTRFLILSPLIKNKKGEFNKLLDSIQKKGYQRVRIDNQVFQLPTDLEIIKTNRHSIDAVIDRISVTKKQLENPQELKFIKSRLNQSIEESLKLTNGLVLVSFILDDSFDFPEKPLKFEDRLFSENLACSDCGISINELQPRLFSFNSPEGACPNCNGLGSILKIKPEKIVAPSLTLSEGAIIPFARTMSHDGWWARLIKIVLAKRGFDFRTTAYEDMDAETQKILLYGHDEVYTVYGENRFGNMTSFEQTFEGFINNLERRFSETNSDFIRREINQFMQRETCEKCQGQRLKPEALAVSVDKLNIAQITNLNIRKAIEWFNILDKKITNKEKIISENITKEIKSRLNFLSSVGLNYLTLNREAGSLAGGEAQRIRLASQIGTGLTGVLYILDEPTIGLHPKDNARLIKTLFDLRDQGNSVVVVEHDREVIANADHIVDFGPLAGEEGGEIVAQGTIADICKTRKSLTGKYLANKKTVSRINQSLALHPTSQILSLKGCSHHNLKNINVNFPLKKLTCITGLSGSGKSTLLHDTLYFNLLKSLGRQTNKAPGEIEEIKLPEIVKRVTLIDQSPIGKTPRSNPATYTKIFDLIRILFASTKDAHLRGYKPGRFSFNVKGGRCETCQGDGQIKIEMQFLPDVYVTCDVCQGKRYNNETLQVYYKEKNIADVLDLSVKEAFIFFDSNSNIKSKLQTLIEVGLGYLRLGQPAPNLSGGEAQRVKLAKELSIKTTDHVVYLLDEPTTGLHFHDVQKLLNVLSALVAQDNTVILIEHNLDIIKNSDWIIDLGPEGGEYGGEVIAEGTPDDIAKNKKSFTGEYLNRSL